MKKQRLADLIAANLKTTETILFGEEYNYPFEDDVAIGICMDNGDPCLMLKRDWVVPFDELSYRELETVRKTMNNRAVFME